MSSLDARPLEGFVDALTSHALTGGGQVVSALPGVVAAALLGRIVERILESENDRELRMIEEEARVARGRLAGRIGRGLGHHATQEVSENIESEEALTDALLDTGHRSAEVVDLATRALDHPQVRTMSEALAALSTAVLLARTGAETAAQNVLHRLHRIEDNVTRTGYKTKANSLIQRARRAEAAFLTTEVTQAGGTSR